MRTIPKERREREREGEEEKEEIQKETLEDQTSK